VSGVVQKPLSKVQQAHLCVFFQVDPKRLYDIGLMPFGRIRSAKGLGTILGICPKNNVWMQMDCDSCTGINISHFSQVKLTRDSVLRQLTPLTADDDEELEHEWPVCVFELIVARGLRTIKYRAVEICIALQSKGLPALVTQTVIDAACSTAFVVPFHKKWKLVTTIKHFCEKS
jgi:hypothetical protein